MVYSSIGIDDVDEEATISTKSNASDMEISNSTQNHTSLPFVNLDGDNIKGIQEPKLKEQRQQRLQGQQHRSGIKDAETKARIPILHYENDWVCINKPAGITVHRSHRTPKHQAVLTSKVKRQLGRKVYPVHRLDHRTSGAMILSFRNGTACGKLHAGLGNKQYVALVRGHFHSNVSKEHDEIIIVNRPIKVHGVEKDAITKFTILATNTNTSIDYTMDESTTNQNNYDNAKQLHQRNDMDLCSLVLCEPITGRTHQIRRHAYSIGHPIIGDTQHGDTKINRYWRNRYGMKQLGLHCISVTVSLQVQNKDRIVVDNGHDADDPLPWVLEHNKDRTTRNGFKDEPRTIHESTTHKHKTITAPLPVEFQNILKQLDDGALLKTASARDSRFELEPIDIQGGTHGRHYRHRKNTPTITSGTKFL